MSEQGENRSFHITCIPGRALMWKRDPTKRKFSFHLSQLEKSENLSSLENSILATKSSILTKGNGNTGGKRISIAANENSKVEKENIVEQLKKLSCRQTDSIKITNEIETKQKASALKDIGNIQKVPGSGAHQNFETPMLALPPTMRRLIDVFLPSGKKRSSSCSSAKFPYKEASNIVDVEQSSLTSVYDFTDIEADDYKKDVSLKTAINDTASNLGIATILDNTIKEQIKEGLVGIDNSMVANLDDSKSFHSSSLANCRDTLTHMNTIDDQEIEWQPNDKKSNEIEKTDTGRVLNKPVLLTSFKSSDLGIVESSGDQNDVESHIQQPCPLTEQNAAEEKINTPIYNNLSQLKRRRMTVLHNNIQPPLSSTDTISHMSIDTSNPKILLLSPVGNTSKHSKSHCSTQSHACKNLKMSDVPNKDRDLQLLQHKEANFSSMSEDLSNSQILLLSPVCTKSKNSMSNCSTQSHIHKTLKMSDVPDKDEDLELLQHEEANFSSTSKDASNSQILLLSPVCNRSKNSTSNCSTQSHTYKKFKMSDAPDKDEDLQLIQHEEANFSSTSKDASNSQILLLSPVCNKSKNSTSNYSTQSHACKNLKISDVPDKDEDLQLLQHEEANFSSMSKDVLNSQILLLSPVCNKSKNSISNCSTHQSHTCKNLKISDVPDKDRDLQLLQCEEASSNITSIDVPNPQILLLSPVYNTNKNSISNCSSQNNAYKDFGTSNEYKKKDKDLQQKKNSSVCMAHDARSKRNSVRRKLNFQKSAGIIVHQSEALFQEKTGENTTIAPRKRYHLPQELVQHLKKRKLKQNLNFEILSNDKPDFILAPKMKKKCTRKPKKPRFENKDNPSLPNKVKVLMYNKASFKRKLADVTDLEVIFDILNSNYREATEDTEAEKICKSYQKYVIKDVANLIYDSVELQAKTKEIKKLYRKIEQKGRQLGTLIDERNKIYHGIANGELRHLD